MNDNPCALSPGAPAASGEPSQPSAPRHHPAPLASPPPDPGRHARKCSICRHPDRDAIEDDFLHWRSPQEIATSYHLPDHSSVYRHAHATGLFDARRHTLRFILGNLLEHADHVPVTATAIVQAVRLYAQLNEAGQWVAPAPAHVAPVDASAGLSRERASSEPSTAPPPAEPSAPAQASACAAGSQISNRQIQELEDAATR